MEEFVSRLWTNPAIRSSSILKKENQILSFVKENSAQLKSSLTRDPYFPDLSWEDIIRLLFTELTDRVVRTVEPRLETVLERVINREILAALGASDFSAVRLKELIVNQLRNKPFRDQLIHVLDTIQNRFFERYVSMALERRKVIYYELVRRDRLEFDSTLIPDYLNFSTLFRPFYHYRIGGDPSRGDAVTLAGAGKNRKMVEANRSRLENELRDAIGMIPEPIIGAGLESWLDASGDNDISGSARLISILVNRSVDFDPQQTHERGAETPDKSWFNINRKTARYYGYDVKFLEELYSIAGDEGW